MSVAPSNERVAASKPQGKLRTDIQGLRALAVAMVVVYHLHEPAFSGGYVGVDVFFVISGFLITTHLIRKPPTSPTALAAFWARRVRRLLPASLTVLAGALAVTRIVAPSTQWEANAEDARSAALYFINWALADRSVDYLAQDNAPTAVQHFWSLAVEEQFYLGWPLLIAAITLAFRRVRVSGRSGMWIGISTVIVVSLWYSVQRTESDPSAAYFVTPTRLWELAAGALLALIALHMTERGIALSPRLRRLGSWAGLAMIIASGLWYSATTPFPGYHAAVPIIGTMVVILCAPDTAEGGVVGRLLALKPSQWLGDVSYSVYLWHWPLIALAPFALDGDPGPVALMCILLMTLVLAGLTERFVERPFRAPVPTGRVPARTFAVGALGMTVIVVAATSQINAVQQSEQEARADLARSVDSAGPCFGAPALDGDARCPPTDYDDLVPAPALAPEDRSSAYRDVGGQQCWSSSPSFPTRPCTFADDGSGATVALFGNSHAGQWLPALEAIAGEHGFAIETHLASQCASAEVRQSFETSEQSDACLSWVERTTEQIVASRPDLVVISNRISVSAVGHDLDSSQAVYEDGYIEVLRRLEVAGIPVLAIRDTPAPGILVPTCIAENPDDWSTCDTNRADRLPDDPVVQAVQRRGGDDVVVADLTDHICEPTLCPAAVGGVIAYFDKSHMTATFARTLAPYLEPHVLSLLSQARD